MNPFAERSVTAKPRPEPEVREPRPQPQPASRTAPARPKPQPEAAPQTKPTPRGADKTRGERSQSASTQSSAAKRSNEPPSASPDGMLFSALLDIAPTPPAYSTGGVDLHAAPRQHAPATQHSAPGGPPMALWQPLESELGRIADREPDGPVAMTLLLPRLGAVDARLQHLPAGGWDIALRFSPAALGALEAHQERCRQALRRRLASRVRLRFEQREAT